MTTILDPGFITGLLPKPPVLKEIDALETPAMDTGAVNYTNQKSGIKCGRDGSIYQTISPDESSVGIFGWSAAEWSLGSGLAVTVLCVLSGGLVSLGSSLLTGLLVTAIVYVGYMIFNCNSSGVTGVVACLIANIFSDLGSGVAGITCAMGGEKSGCLGGSILGTAVDPTKWGNIFKANAIFNSNWSIGCGGTLNIA
jgi:hypothetical protein